MDVSYNSKDDLGNFIDEDDLTEERNIFEKLDEIFEAIAIDDNREPDACEPHPAGANVGGVSVNKRSALVPGPSQVIENSPSISYN